MLLRLIVVLLWVLDFDFGSDDDDDDDEDDDLRCVWCL